MTAPHPLSYFDRLADFDGKLWGKTFKDYSWQREPGPPTDSSAQHACPACGGQFDYHGPLNPLRFACPLCSFWSDDPEQEPHRPTWLTWRAVAYEEKIELGDPLCSICSAPMVERSGKYGRFWGCSAYAKTRCKGRPGQRPRVTVTETRVELVLWVESEPWVSERKAWEDAEARKEAYRRKQW